MSKVPSPYRSVWYLMGHTALAVSGFVVMLLGVALCATFWLLPVGLPLGVLGAAFMGAAGESPQVKLGSEPESETLSPKESVRDPVLLSDYETGQGLGALGPAPLKDQSLSWYQITRDDN